MTSGASVRQDATAAGETPRSGARPRGEGTRGEGDDPARRRLSYYMLLRLVVTTLLLAASVAGDGEEGAMAISPRFVSWLIGFTYALTLLSAMGLRRGVAPARLAAIQLAFDLVAATLLVHADGGAESGFVVLYLFAVIGGATALPGRAGLAVVAAAALAYSAIAIGDRLGWLPAWPAVAARPVGRLRGILFPLITNVVSFVAIAALARRWVDEEMQQRGRATDRGLRLSDLTALHDDVVRSLTSGLLTINEQGIVLSLNPCGEEILGRSLPPGRRLADLLPEMSEFLGAIPGDGAHRRGELAVTVADGERRTLGLSVAVLGRTRGRLVNFQDLTELRRMQHRIERTERLAAIGRLAAGVAHEIRNPLAAISGSVELLRPSLPEDGEGRELMDIVTREAERLNRLITDLLDFARPRRPEKASLDVGLTLGEILRVVENDRRLNPTANRFHLEIPEALSVEADPGQLRQVVLNLVFNAADATPGGEPIQLSARADGNVVRIDVTDRGPGIPAQVRARVFEPFFTTKKGGTGLGLATVHRIIEEHHGSIEISDAPGGGTVFTVRLPRARAATEAA